MKAISRPKTSLPPSLPPSRTPRVLRPDRLPKFSADKTFPDDLYSFYYNRLWQISLMYRRGKFKKVCPVRRIDVEFCAIKQQPQQKRNELHAFFLICRVFRVSLQLYDTQFTIIKLLYPIPLALL